MHDRILSTSPSEETPSEISGGVFLFIGGDACATADCHPARDSAG
jgi:hypothetical protein